MWSSISWAPLGPVELMNQAAFGITIKEM